MALVKSFKSVEINSDNVVQLSDIFKHMMPLLALWYPGYVSYKLPEIVSWFSVDKDFTVTDWVAVTVTILETVILFSFEYCNKNFPALGRSVCFLFWIVRIYLFCNNWKLGTESILIYSSICLTYSSYIFKS